MSPTTTMTTTTKRRRHSTHTARPRGRRPSPQTLPATSRRDKLSLPPPNLMVMLLLLLSALALAPQSTRATPTAQSTCSPMEFTPLVDCSILNALQFPVYIFWVGFDCTQTLYATIEPNTAVMQPSYINHTWVARNSSGQFLTEFTVRSDTAVNWTIDAASLAESTTQPAPNSQSSLSPSPTGQTSDPSASPNSHVPSSGIPLVPDPTKDVNSTSSDPRSIVKPPGLEDNGNRSGIITACTIAAVLCVGMGAYFLFDRFKSGRTPRGRMCFFTAIASKNKSSNPKTSNNTTTNNIFSNRSRSGSVTGPPTTTAITVAPPVEAALSKPAPPESNEDESLLPIANALMYPLPQVSKVQLQTQSQSEPQEQQQQPAVSQASDVAPHQDVSDAPQDVPDAPAQLDDDAHQPITADPPAVVAKVDESHPVTAAQVVETSPSDSQPAESSPAPDEAVSQEIKEEPDSATPAALGTLAASTLNVDHGEGTNESISFSWFYDRQGNPNQANPRSTQLAIPITSRQSSLAGAQKRSHSTAGTAAAFASASRAQLDKDDVVSPADQISPNEVESSAGKVVVTVQTTDLPDLAGGPTSASSTGSHGTQNSVNATPAVTTASQKLVIGNVYRTLHYYAQMQSDELTVRPNDQLLICEMFDDGWALACTMDGRQGVVPCCCFQP